MGSSKKDAGGCDLLKNLDRIRYYSTIWRLNGQGALASPSRHLFMFNLTVIDVR